MPIGGGKYDAEVAALLIHEGAEIVLLCVGGGVRGGGFDVATIDMELTKQIPRVLREIADSIEKDLANEG